MYTTMENCLKANYVNSLLSSSSPKLNYHRCYTQSIYSLSKPFFMSQKPFLYSKARSLDQKTIPTCSMYASSNTENESDTQRVGKRTDIKTILILGAGPIVIGQAGEFDYSGTQACKALKEEGYKVILINSNPATIMTDPGFVDRTYVAGMTAELVVKVLEQERPDAILPTMGGQTALNLAVELAESGALEKYGVELIGAKLEAIKKAEDRDLFKQV